MDTYEPYGATTLGRRFRGDDEYHTHRLFSPVEGGISSVEAAPQDKAARLEEHTGLTRSRGVF
jgi:hypothetical protein